MSVVFECPTCKSEDVQELMLVWFHANEPYGMSESEWSKADRYEEAFYCSECQENKTSLTERTVSEE